MNKRIAICGLVMSLASLLLGYLVHGLLLGRDYQALVGTLLRTPQDSQHYFPWMIVAHLLVGYAMTWIYAKGSAAERNVLGQGLRFGIAAALLVAVPNYLIYYAVQPTPGALAVKQIAFDGLRFVLLGLLLAYLQPQRTALAERD
ncbi:hypothetical protein [Luteimonas aquatica]|uniref:hypothetical protein n=1 Tax=Luteimonas aquatica TaxID=450364 RepID=UPI001F5A6F61|nr:hypothetical protein [Luteimonas aquatica]